MCGQIVVAMVPNPGAASDRPPAYEHRAAAMCVRPPVPEDRRRATCDDALEVGISRAVL
jgi:hypothetical protein